jgi:hypothetical protein
VNAGPGPAEFVMVVIERAGSETEAPVRTRRQARRR